MSRLLRFSLTLFVSYLSASSTSGSSPSVAEKRTFGALSVRIVEGEVHATNGLGIREHSLPRAVEDKRSLKPRTVPKRTQKRGA